MAQLCKGGACGDGFGDRVGVVLERSLQRSQNDARVLCAKIHKTGGGKGRKGRLAFVGFDSWSFFFFFKDFRCDLDLLISHIFHLMRNELFCGSSPSIYTQSLDTCDYPVHIGSRLNLAPKKMQG